MEILNKLNKTTTKPQKRVGRGYGSAVGGHTTGRGNKGDKIRGTTKITFDGTKIKKGWIKRTPFLRGKNRTQKLNTNAVFNLDFFEARYQAGDSIDSRSLGYVSVKVLGNGKITKAISFQKGFKFSESAKKQILAAGGKIDQ